MYAGRDRRAGADPTLFADTRMPYTEALMRLDPELADPSHTRLPAIDGPPARPHPPARRAAAFAPRCPYAQDKCREDGAAARAPPATPGHLLRLLVPASGTARGRRGPAGRTGARVPAGTALAT